VTFPNTQVPRDLLEDYPTGGIYCSGNIETSGTIDCNGLTPGQTYTIVFTDLVTENLTISNDRGAELFNGVINTNVGFNSELEFTAYEGITFDYTSFGTGGYYISGPEFNWHELQDGRAKTLVINSKPANEGLVTTLDAVPEWWGRIGTELLSFKNGRLYLHDDSENTNIFYGDQKPAGIALLMNQGVGFKKWLQGIAVDGGQVPDWVHFRVNEENVQSSDLKQIDFVLREGIYYADALLDRLTPGFDLEEVTYDEIQIQGDRLRGKVLQAYVEWDNLQVQVSVIELAYKPSFGHR